jgi:hypothetical protein
VSSSDAVLAGRRPRRPHQPASPARGGILGWLLAALVFCSALAVLGWMLLLPAYAQTRVSTAVGGAELRVRGLMGDPFAGRATVTGWTLRAAGPGATEAPLLARGGASEIVSQAWHTALGATPPDGGFLLIDRLTLRATELHLAPDADGRWPLLALGATAGLPYERGGKIGDSPRVRVKHLVLQVETVLVRDATTGRDTPVRIDWRGEFRDLEHSRPVVAALLAAAAAAATSGQP